MIEPTMTRQKTIRERARRFADGDRLPDEMAAEDRGGHRPALDRGDQRGRSRARNPSRPYQTPKPERRSWVHLAIAFDGR